VIFDQGLSAIVIAGSANCQFDCIKFYLVNYDLQIGVTTHDCQWSNCHSEYNRAVEFGSVGKGTSIPMSNSGSLAISWPGTYTSESIDVQLI
jgi:hypothetical protein